MPKGLSLEDIAKLSGVSRSTVSRVINERPYVSADSREKVLRVIREHNYHPNLAARALASNRSRVVGILIPHDISDLFSDPFFPVLLQGTTTASNGLGYSVALWLANTGDHENLYSKSFNTSLIDGLIIASATYNDDFMTWLATLNKPYVFVGSPPRSLHAANFVDIDNRGGGRMATQHLLDLGCRRIGMIEGRSKQIASIDRRQGYIDALEQAGLPIERDLIIPNGNYTESGGYKCMKILLARDVDGVFTANDMMAVGALRAIREAGLDIPQDVAVIGFDDVSYAAMANPPLSTIRQPISTLGEEATRVLIAILEGETDAPAHKVLPVELVVRESSVRKVLSINQVSPA